VAGLPAGYDPALALVGNKVQGRGDVSFLREIEHAGALRAGLALREKDKLMSIEENTAVGP
jgi:hypothetical protein